MLLGEQGCRAVWTLVPLPSLELPWWWMGSSAAPAKAGLSQARHSIGWGALLHLPKNVMVLFVGNRTRKP